MPSLEPVGRRAVGVGVRASAAKSSSQASRCAESSQMPRRKPSSPTADADVRRQPAAGGEHEHHARRGWRRARWRPRRPRRRRPARRPSRPAVCQAAVASWADARPARTTLPRRAPVAATRSAWLPVTRTSLPGGGVVRREDVAGRGGRGRRPPPRCASRPSAATTATTSSGDGEHDQQEERRVDRRRAGRTTNASRSSQPTIVNIDAEEVVEREHPVRSTAIRSR